MSICQALDLVSSQFLVAFLCNGNRVGHIGKVALQPLEGVAPQYLIHQVI